VKIEPRQVEAFLRKPAPGVRGVVLYGTDDGLIAERAVQIASTVCDDLTDPFRVVDIAGDVLKADPARLADEFSAISLIGGRRVIRVRPAGEGSVAALENLVAATAAGDALVVLEAGELNPRSALRILAEAEPCLAALPCYMDSREALAGLVESTARTQGMRVEPDALDWIVERLGGDRAQTRSEIDKLMLYKASDDDKAIALADAVAVLGDTAAIDADDVIAATFDGQPEALDRALDRVFDGGGNAVQLVRAVQRHVDSLHRVAAHVANGSSLDSALARVPFLPRGGPVRQMFERHLRSWPLARLSAAIPAVLDAEIACKSTGMPDQAIARRLCLRLAPTRNAGRR
jgi:DNA polymerase-3 subunit delta